MKGITEDARQETISLIKRIAFSPRQLGCKNVLLPVLSAVSLQIAAILIDHVSIPRFVLLFPYVQ